MGRVEGERREFVLTLIAGERVENKQRKVWINQETRRGQGRRKMLCSISSPIGRGKNARLLLTMCLAGHNWADLEMVGSVFWGCGDQGELIRW